MDASYRPRLAETRLAKLAQRFPVVLVTGARQTGKSTLLQQMCSSTHETFVFEPYLDVAGARHDPELFLRLNPRR